MFTHYLGKCYMVINNIKLGSVSKSSHKLKWSLKIEVLSHSAFTNCWRGGIYLFFPGVYPSASHISPLICALRKVAEEFGSGFFPLGCYRSLHKSSECSRNLLACCQHSVCILRNGGETSSENEPKFNVIFTSAKDSLLITSLFPGKTL